LQCRISKITFQEQTIAFPITKSTNYGAGFPNFSANQSLFGAVLFDLCHFPKKGNAFQTQQALFDRKRVSLGANSHRGIARIGNANYLQ
jgi:hypothetical protein